MSLKFDFFFQVFQFNQLKSMSDSHFLLSLLQDLNHLHIFSQDYFISLRFHQVYLFQTLLSCKAFIENSNLVHLFSFFLLTFFAFLKLQYFFHLFLEHTQSFPRLELGYTIFFKKNFGNFCFDYNNWVNKNLYKFLTTT